jgi:hypothetical protein
VLGPFPRVSVSSDFSRSCCDNKKTIQHQFFDFFFELHKYRRIRSTHAHSLLRIHIRKPNPYEHLRKTVPAHLEINKVTTGVSLSTGTSSTTESTLNPEIDEVTIGASLSTGTSSTTESTLNPEINLEKCEHSYQVENLNPCE